MYFGSRMIFLTLFNGVLQGNFPFYGFISMSEIMFIQTSFAYQFQCIGIFFPHVAWSLASCNNFVESLVRPVYDFFTSVPHVLTHLIEEAVPISKTIHTWFPFFELLLSIISRCHSRYLPYGIHGIPRMTKTSAGCSVQHYPAFSLVCLNHFFFFPASCVFVEPVSKNKKLPIVAFVDNMFTDGRRISHVLRLSAISVTRQSNVGMMVSKLKYIDSTHIKVAKVPHSFANFFPVAVAYSVAIRSRIFLTELLFCLALCERGFSRSPVPMFFRSFYPWRAQAFHVLTNPVKNMPLNRTIIYTWRCFSKISPIMKLASEVLNELDRIFFTHTLNKETARRAVQVIKYWWPWGGFPNPHAVAVSLFGFTLLFERCKVKHFY